MGEKSVVKMSPNGMFLRVFILDFLSPMEFKNLLTVLIQSAFRFMAFLHFRSKMSWYFINPFKVASFEVLFRFDLVRFTDIFRWFYLSWKFRLLREREIRQPYLDSHSGIQQTKKRQYLESHRNISSKPDQVWTILYLKRTRWLKGLKGRGNRAG